ncbi:MAG: SufE family protein [Solimonas sp.]
MNVDELAETFELLGDWEERYRYLIELGRKLPPMPDGAHIDTNKVRGCMSQVWMTHEIKPGPPKTLEFRGDSDAHIVKGLIAVLFMLTSGKTPRDIIALDIGGAFERLGLESNISMNRRNGFYAMVERIKHMAAAESSKESAS